MIRNTLFISFTCATCRKWSCGRGLGQKKEKYYREELFSQFWLLSWNVKNVDVNWLNAGQKRQKSTNWQVDEKKHWNLQEHWTDGGLTQSPTSKLPKTGDINGKNPLYSQMLMLMFFWSSFPNPLLQEEWHNAERVRLLLGSKESSLTRAGKLTAYLSLDFLGRIQPALERESSKIEHVKVSHVTGRLVCPDWVHADTYRLFVVVHVRQTKVVLLHEVQVLAHFEEQVLTFCPFLQRRIQTHGKNIG